MGVTVIPEIMLEAEMDDVVRARLRTWQPANLAGTQRVQ